MWIDSSTTISVQNWFHQKDEWPQKGNKGSGASEKEGLRPRKKLQKVNMKEFGVIRQAPINTIQNYST